LEHF
jgi:hypothetical protein